MATTVTELWDFERPVESERRFRERLAELGPGADDEARAEVTTQIARAQGLQGEYAAGHATLDDAERLLGRSDGRAAVRIALERGRLFNSAGDAARAMPCFLTAFELAKGCEEAALAIDAAHMLGIAAAPDEGMAWNQRALAMAEGADDPAARAWIGPLLNNIGWTYHDRGDYAAALDAFERGVAFRRERGQVRETRIAEWSVARTLRSLGRLEEALAIQRRLAEELTAAGEADPYVAEELGECLHALGLEAEARSHFAAAYEALSADPWMAEHEAGRLTRLRGLAGREA